MTGRITMTVDGTPVSDADIARMHAEEELHAQWQRRTARVIAGAASDVQDCRMLLDMLGLDERVVAQARSERAGAAKDRRARRKPAARSGGKRSTVGRTRAHAAA